MMHAYLIPAPRRRLAGPNDVLDRLVRRANAANIAIDVEFSPRGRDFVSEPHPRPIWINYVEIKVVGVLPGERDLNGSLLGACSS